MAKNGYKNADEAYKAAKFDIANLIGWLECELGKESNHIDWSHVGSLVEVRSQLIQTLAFFSNMTEKQINESLEDLKGAKQ